MSDDAARDVRLAGEEQFGYMTLRDLFAAAVMAGMYASGKLGAADTAEALSEEAYKVADAMLAARMTP